MKKIAVCLSSLFCVLMITMLFYSQEVNAANGKTYALLISGISGNSSVTDTDVSNMINRINANKLEKYSGKKVYTTLNYNSEKKGAGTSAEELEKHIKIAYKDAAENDLAIFFYSGHGTPKNGKGVGITISDEYYYSYKGLAQLLSKSIKCKKIIVVMNACYSGGFYDLGISKLADRSRFVVFLSSQSWQKSQGEGWYDVPSRFGRTFVNGLGFSSKKVYADFNNDGKVTVQEMKTYLDTQLRADLIDNNINWNDQNPTYYATDNNYVIYQYNNSSVSKSLVLNKTALELWKGQSVTLTATKKNISGTLKWTTSNSKVAAVSNRGKITAKGVGKATIKVTAGGIFQTCRVTVKKPTIKLNKSKLSITLGSSVKTQLKASVSGASKKVKWKSSNTKIATVSKTGIISPKKNGKVTISATANGVTAKCVVTIKPSIKLDKTSATIYISGNKTVQLKASVYGKNKTVTWKSSNKKVAAVDRKGKVTAKGVGNAIITATANGVKATCKISVETKKNGNDDVVTFQSLRGKRFAFYNDNGWYYLNIYENENRASLYIYGGSVNLFRVYWNIDLEENKYQYTVREQKNGYKYDINLVPHKECVIVSVFCRNKAFNGYDLVQCRFKE